MSPSPAGKPIRVLVVEDQKEDFQYIQYLLSRNPAQKYQVDWVATYETALDALKRNDHDVGLFDYALGARTGLELLREATTITSEMPVILLTGHDSAQVDQEALAAGAADYLCKVGINTTQLERAIRYSLRHAAMLAVVKKSQNQLEAFMRNVPCAVCICDAEGRVLFQNEIYERHFSTPGLLETWAAAPRTGSWPYSDGNSHWLVNSFSMDAHGRRLEGLAAVEITERIRAEQMLQQTMRVLNGILASLPIIVANIDQDGTFLESRGSGLAAIGRRDVDLVGTNAFTAFPKIADELRAAVNGGSVNFLWEVEHEGRRHFFDSYFRFDESRGSGALGFAVNVTGRVEAESARNRQNQLLRAILKNLPAIAGRVDKDGRVLEADGDGLERHTLRPSGLLGKVFTELYPQSRGAFSRAFRGGSANFSVSGEHDDEEWHLDFYVFFDAENGSGAIFFGRDVTERRWLERKLLNISDTEQQRIGADLHDGLGQSLTGIACMMAAFRDRLQKTHPAESEQANMITQLVNDTIAQTRALARGLCPVQLEKTGLPSALEDLTYQVQLLHGVECRFDAEGPPPNCEHGTAVHLFRITQEAINNAIRHGQAKKINVTLRTNGEAHRIIVQDDGIGFDPNQPNGEPGVGLRLMNYRAGIIGGTFNIASQPGGGTRTECIFPNQPKNNESPN